MAKALIIYGYPCSGKSTLEFNLRKLIFGTCWTQEDFQFNERIAFLGHTVDRAGNMMVTGGAEAFLKVPDVVPSVEWFVAALPVRGRPGVQVAWDFLRSTVAPQDIHAILLHTRNAAEYRSKRTQFASGFDTKLKRTKASLAFPPGISGDNCRSFETESLPLASMYARRVLGIDESLAQVVLLEDLIQNEPNWKRRAFPTRASVEQELEPEPVSLDLPSAG